VIQDHPADTAKFRMADNHQNRQSSIFLTHDAEAVYKDPELSPVFRILPTQNVYNAIYNNFTKKVLIEEFSKFNLREWIHNPVFWYDKCYYHIQECYYQICNDISTNTIQNIVDFDRITDCDYIANWLLQNFNLEFTTNRRMLVQHYASMQLQLELKDDNSILMQDIIGPITDKMLLENPWFWAYIVFKFEHNNNLLETDRVWSVDNFNRPQCIDDLLGYQYCIELK
jgi:hypothetical protein